MNLKQIRAENLADGKLKPRWWSSPGSASFPQAERRRRRAAGKRARASRKANRPD